MNTSAVSRSDTARGPRIAMRFCNEPNSAGGGCEGFCCICRIRRPSLFVVGVKAKKTTKKVVIPTDAPAVISLDQGETRSKAFGPPLLNRFIVNARSGPKMIVETVNICMVLTYLGNIFNAISPFA